MNHMELASMFQLSTIYAGGNNGRISPQTNIQMHASYAPALPYMWSMRTTVLSCMRPESR